MSRINACRTGFAHWRQQARQRRGLVPMPVVQATTAKPRAIRAVYQVTTTADLVATATIQIGGFVISPEGDPQLLGHPQIRY